MARRRAALWCLACAAVVACGATVACGAEDAAWARCAEAAALRIDELMVDPPGADGAGEWIELANSGAEAARLAGLCLVVGTGPGRRRHCLLAAPPLPAGGRFVVGNRAAPGVELDAAYGAALTLPNRAGEVALCCGEATVSRVAYGAAAGLVPVPAVSLQRDGGAADGGTADRWCVAPAGALGAAAGSPGRPNPACPGMAGAPPCLVAVMADPAGADDGREWLEVWLPRPAALTGLWLVQTTRGRTRRWQLWAPPEAGPGRVSLRVQRATMPLPAPGWGLAVGREALANAASQLELQARDGTCLDAVALPRARTDCAWGRDAPGCGPDAAAAEAPDGAAAAAAAATG